jgi:hypothetical protein
MERKSGLRKEVRFELHVQHRRHIGPVWIALPGKLEIGRVVSDNKQVKNRHELSIIGRLYVDLYQRHGQPDI